MFGAHEWCGGGGGVDRKAQSEKQDDETFGTTASILVEKVIID